MAPEAQARKNIDKMLIQAGWHIQNYKDFNPSAGTGIAVREHPTDTGPADYLLYIDRNPAGVLEAKPEGTPLTPVEDQSVRYANSKLKWRTNQEPLRFLYESTGVETRFTDTADPQPRSREVYCFHRPETLKDWQRQSDTLRKRLQNFPPLHTERLRDCQSRAITNLEASFTLNKPRALIQMATGAGKTFTAITSIYRLLKFAGAKRILFLVDTKNLGEQAQQGFMAFTPNDDRRTFGELYNVQRLSSRFIDKNAQVCISTIQRMFSILKGEELDEAAEEESLNEINQPDQPVDIAYNPQVPPETFDFIIIDECHRSIYNRWRQVIEYFDAYLIGLTATPDSRTYSFFNKNVVSEYSYEDAVADGVNVPFDVYTIETSITKKGGILPAKEYIDRRDRLTRRKRWEQLDEEVIYTPNALDRDVVNLDQIRTVIRTFKERLPEIFPRRGEVPKTLIFAKTDFHADDIIQIVREEFGQGNDFCKKVTNKTGYKTDTDGKRKKDGELASTVLNDFRNRYNPRIAVTVDMIATGTDVQAIECLLFMRDVKSRSYYEQMKGRGTRIMLADDLQQRTPSSVGNKTHFVVVDAVGVSKSLKTDSRPLERRPTVSLKELMLSVVMGGDTSEDTLTSLANRLTRLEKQLTVNERQQLATLAGGKSINRVVMNLLDAYNPDKIEAKANTLCTTDEVPTPQQLNDAQQLLIEEAVRVFDSVDYRDGIEHIRRSHEQLMDSINLDTLQFAGWDTTKTEKASELVQDFKTYLEQHKDEVTALQIFYNQPYRRKELTYYMIKSLFERLKAERPQLAPFAVWEAYKALEEAKSATPKSELIALVSLIRRVLEIDPDLTDYGQTVNRNFQNWVFRRQAGSTKFNEEQMEWLRMMKEYVAKSIHIDKEDFKYSPFAEKGGLGRVWSLFGEQTFPIIEELNEYLAA
ncbi:MAG: type site-specific deoxyribonuclease [Spirosoma sp.]|nr:type site-specific deoxyribonuclease [Spirosoma sp.]